MRIVRNQRRRPADPQDKLAVDLDRRTCGTPRHAEVAAFSGSAAHDRQAGPRTCAPAVPPPRAPVEVPAPRPRPQRRARARPRAPARQTGRRAQRTPRPGPRARRDSPEPATHPRAPPAPRPPDRRRRPVDGVSWTRQGNGIACSVAVRAQTTAVPLHPAHFPHGNPRLTPGVAGDSREQARPVDRRSWRAWSSRDVLAKHFVVPGNSQAAHPGWIPRGVRRRRGLADRRTRGRLTSSSRARSISSTKYSRATWASAKTMSCPTQ